MFLKIFILGPENVCNTVRVSEKLLRTNFVSCHEFLRMYFVFFRISAVTEVDGVLAENSMELVENMESPRLIKTHLSFDMLPTSITKNKAKVSKK